MALKARVTRTTGRTAHLAAHVEGDVVVADGALPIASWVQILANQDGIFLLYLDAAGQEITDTWHLTLEDAKRQARFEFGIEESEWLDDGK